MTSANPSAVALFIEPPSHHFYGDRLFDADAVPFAGDQLMAPYTHLRSVLGRRGIAVRTADALPAAPDGGRNIYVSIGNLARYRSLSRRPDVALSALFAMECPANDPALYRQLGEAARSFRRIYSWSDSASLLPWTGTALELQPFCWPQSFDDVHEALWSRTDRKLLVIMNGNKVPASTRATLHRQRLEAIEYFGRTGEIDLYGREWDKPPHRVGLTHIPYTFRLIERRLRAWKERVEPDPLLRAARKAWRGPAASKSQTLSGYKFCICFENMNMKGWITEKIFDCFFTGTIPIYLGAPDIDRYVAPDCYVDMRRFASYAELREFLVDMTDAQRDDYREAARAYLRSPMFKPFSKDAFVDRFSRIIEEDASAIGTARG